MRPFSPDSTMPSDTSGKSITFVRPGMYPGIYRFAIMRICVPEDGLASYGPKQAVGLTTTTGSPSCAAAMTALHFDFDHEIRIVRKQETRLTRFSSQLTWF